jgi:Uma2 family endonuclease
LKVREAPIVQTEMTAEEYMLWPEVEDARDELVAGMIEYIPFGDAPQGLISTYLCQIFNPYAVSTGGLLSLRVGMITRRNPDTVRGPFLIYYTPEHRPNIKDGYFETPADLIVEVAGYSNPPKRLQEKIEDYLNMGCRRVWAIHPNQRTLSIYRSMDAVRELNENDTVEDAEVLPGFTCKVADLFGEIRS